MGLLFNRRKKQTKTNTTPQGYKTNEVGIFGTQKNTFTKNKSTTSYNVNNESFPSKSYPGTPFEKEVITFDERKKISLPSGRGLYVAEILLLYYCSLGTYPNPKNGYPEFWWYEYGIQDVNYMLSTLERRGFIYFGPLQHSLNGLSVTELKQILKERNLPVSGKKAELIERISQSVSNDELLAAGVKRKYALTDLGQIELEENAYVPYMHKCPQKTIENSVSEYDFNVWSINQLLGYGNTSDWKEVVEAQKVLLDKKLEKEELASLNNLEGEELEYSMKMFKENQSLRKQLNAANEAKAKYAEDKNIADYIEFWEHMWSTEKLVVGPGWLFELPRLYIREKRYDDALNILNRIKDEHSFYADEADKYIAKVDGLIEKQNNKNKK